MQKRKKTTTATTFRHSSTSRGRGHIEEEERQLIHSVFEFGDKSVEEVMTPRTEIVAVPNTASVRETCDLMIETKHSRLPVFANRSTTSRA